MTEPKGIKLEYNFRLGERDIQSGLADYILELANDRTLSKKIKVGLTLLAQLDNENTELLYKLYPFLRRNTSNSPDDIDDLKRRLAALEARAQDNSDIPDTRKGGIPLAMPVAKMPAGAPRDLIYQDVNDNDDLNIRQVEGDNGTIESFMHNLIGLMEN